MRKINNEILALILILISISITGCINYQMDSTDKSLITTKIDRSIYEPKSISMTPESNAASIKLPERKVISTATITLEVPGVQAAINEITNITIESGGFISSSSFSDIGNNRKNGFLIAKVPQKNFYQAIEQIGTLGAEKQRQVSGQDVTEEFIDLGARLENLKKQEARLQEILKMAATVKDIIEVEHELERIRGEIESLTGRLSYLNQSVEMSSISVNVIEPVPFSGEDWGISDAIRNAARGFIESIRGIIIFTGFIIPILVYLGIIVLMALGIKRKILPRMRG